MAAYFVAIPLAIVLVIYFWQVRDPLRRARFLCGTGLVLTGIVSFFFAAFLVGETIDDPGGWPAVRLISLWFVPLVVLSVAVWLWPDQMAIPLIVLSAALVMLNVWFAVDSQGWRDFEDRAGPVRTIAMFVVATAISLLAKARPLMSGVLVLVATAIPMLIVQLAVTQSLRLPGGALVTIGSPYVMIGLLYLIAASIGGRGWYPQFRRVRRGSAHVEGLVR